MCDDPLSALDAGTAKKVFERLFKNPSTATLFANSAVVLVTHASHFLNRVDQILVIVDGRAKFLGDWDELIAFKPSDAGTVAAVEFIQSCVQEAHSDEVGVDSTRDSEVPARKVKEVNGDSGALITEETREHGLSSLKTWFLWFKHAGGAPFLVLQVFLMTIDRVAYVGVEYWLAQWTQGATNSITFFGAHFRPQSDGMEAQYQYLKVYAIILAISVFSTIARYVDGDCFGFEYIQLNKSIMTFLRFSDRNGSVGDVNSVDSSFVHFSPSCSLNKCCDSNGRRPLRQKNFLSHARKHIKSSPLLL